MNSASTSPSPTTSVAFPRPGTSLYYALQNTPTEQKAALLNWLCWWHEVSQIPFVVSDPGVAETKLNWWLQEIQTGAQGQARHPLLQRLLTSRPPVAPEMLPPWPLWRSQIEGLIQLVHQTRWLDEAGLAQHMAATTGAACESAACLLGATSPDALAAARQLGIGLRQAHMLARIGQDARAGWVNVGIDVLQRHDVKAHQLSKPDTAQVPAGLGDLVQYLRDQAHANLEAALASIRALPRQESRALRPLVTLAHLHMSLMVVICQHPQRILHERIILTPLRKWWIATQVKWGWLR
jgi:phytoene synthase